MTVYACGSCGGAITGLMTRCPQCGVRGVRHRISRDGVSLPAKTVVKTYRGSQAAAIKAFNQHAKEMACDDYYPISQNWQDGRYGFGSFLVALLLCVILIGVLVFIYMLIVKPDGTLMVTYEHRPYTGGIAAPEKTCPRCAEQVKAAAIVCRFCGFEFAQGTV